MTPAGRPHRDPDGVRNRAVRVLTEFFASDGERGRRTVFRQAFGDLSPDPSHNIDFSGPAAEFAAEAVDRLLHFGGTGRGRHSLSLLLTTMREFRGRQPDPDFYELPRLLDRECGLPTREEELQYFSRLILEIEQKARLYSPLRGSVRMKPGNTIPRAWQDDRNLALLRHRSRRRECEGEFSAGRDYDDVLSAFTDVRRAALLGAPGSGKSTTLRRLALETAARAQEDSKAPLPLLVEMGKWTGDEPFASFLANGVDEIGWAATALAKANRLLLLLDGLNEMPTGKRAGKAEEVRTFLHGLDPGTPIFVSCRSEDYRDELDLDIDTLSIEPLSPQRIRDAVGQWVAASGEAPERAERFFWQLAGDERLAAVFEKWKSAGAGEVFWTVSDPREQKEVYSKTSSEEDTLWRRHIPNPRSLLRLASNPFMLTMLYFVWGQENGVLPRNRGDLFRLFVLNLLNREGLVHEDARLKPEGERLLTGLADVAWRMQTDRVSTGAQEAADFGVLTVASRASVLESLGGESLLKKALDATLLEGSTELRFRHQLLQEYFTAEALATRLSEVRAVELWPPDQWWRRSGWEETAVLLAGFQTSDCTGVIRWLADAQPEVAAQCIVESGADIADRPGVLRELQAAWMPRLLGEQTPEGRAAVGRALGSLDLDNRKGVGVTVDGIPDIDWVEIPSGDFLYQGGERRKIESFLVARYPVTNAQYQAFLRAEEGYRQDCWWKALTDPDREPQPPEWTESNHPRETVCWYEAMAFCAWLSNRVGKEVSLPTEWQWERAARGTDGRIYPWGNKYVAGRANTDETKQNAGPHYLRRTSPVGIYSAGASIEWILDLSGNVWEWCLNERSRPRNIQACGTECQVLRGGSWDFDQDHAHAVIRNYYYLHPYLRYNNVGFRVVCSSPSPAAEPLASDHWPLFTAALTECSRYASI